MVTLTLGRGGVATCFYSLVALHLDSCSIYRQGTRDGGKSIPRGVGWQRVSPSRIDSAVQPLSFRDFYSLLCTLRRHFSLVVTLHFPQLDFVWIPLTTVFTRWPLNLERKLGQKIKCYENLLHLIGRKTWHTLVFHFVSLSAALYLHSLRCCKDRGISRTVSSCKWNPEGWTREERKMIVTVLCISLSTECKSSSLTRSLLFSQLRCTLGETLATLSLCM